MKKASGRLKHKKTVFLAGFLLGMLAFVCLYGVKILDVTYDSWLLPNDEMAGRLDLSQHYLGWVAYRGSGRGFPFGLIDSLTYPEKISVIYTDCVPLAAFFFKLLSPILPETFQYMGLLCLLGFGLQGGFAALLLSRWSESFRVVLTGSLFFICSNPVLQRIYAHTALACQWMIPAAMCLWAYDGALGNRRKTLLWSALMAVTLLTQAYFLPMVYGILCGSLLWRLLCKGQPGYTAAGLLCPLFAAVATGWLSGMFYGDVPAGASGYGVFSFNLNGLWNAHGTSRLLPSLYYYPGQDEGYAFLGVGVLALLLFVAAGLLLRAVRQRDAAAAALRRREVRAAVLSLMIVSGVFTAAAASTSVTLGARQHLFMVPQAVVDMLGIFRSSGRLVWPVYYGCILAAVAGAAVLWKKRPALLCALFLGLFALQMWDEEAFWGITADYCRAEHRGTALLQEEAWDALPEEYTHLTVYPRGETLVSNLRGYVLEDYALRRGLTMNVAYLARDITPQADRRVYDAFEEYYGGAALPEDTLYVFLDELPAEDIPDMHYYFIDGFTLGLPRALEGYAELSHEPWEEAA